MKIPSSFKVRSLPVQTCCGLAAIFLPIRLQAQTWDGGGTANFWTAGANWIGDVAPLNNGLADIIFAGTTRLSPVLDQNYSVHSITFAENAGVFNLTSSTNIHLDLGSGGITNNSTQAQIINMGSWVTLPVNPADITISLAADQTWNAANGNLRFQVPVYVNGKTLTLSGNKETIFQGAVALKSGGLLGSGDVVISSGATARLEVGDSSFTGRFIVQEGGTLISSASSSTGRSGVGGGIILEGAIRAEGTASGAGQVQVPVLIRGNAVVNGSNSMTFNKPVTVEGDRSLNIMTSGGVSMGSTGVVIPADNSLTRLGAGNLTLRTSGALAGALYLNQGATGFTGSLASTGKLEINDTLVPGSTKVTTGSTTIAQGGEIALNSGVLNVNGDVASPLAVEGTLRLNGGTLTLKNAQGLTVRNGGSLLWEPPAVITGDGNVAGQITVTGTGSRFTAAGDAGIGGAGIVVQAGGVMEVAGRLLAGDASKSADIRVTGAGSNLHVTGSGGNSTLGMGGYAYLHADTGGTIVFDQGLDVGGSQSGSEGVLAVTERGGSITIGGTLSVGTNGGAGNSGTVLLGDGRINAQDLMLGGSSGSTGTVSLSTGADLNISGSTSIYSGGTLWIASGGIAHLGDLQVIAGGAVRFQNGGTLDFRGDFAVDSNGMMGATPILTTSQNVILTGTTSVNAGGTLSITGGSLTTNALTVDGASGGFLMSAGTVKAAGLLTNAGSLTVSGGAMETGSITSAGSLKVQGGTLATGGLSNSGNLTVSGGTLTTGSLTSTGDLQLNNGGELVLTTGPLTINGGLATLNAGGILADNGLGIVVNSGGGLVFNHHTWDAGFSSLTANTGGSITYDNGTAITSAVLSGAGTHQIGSGGARLISGYLSDGSTLQVNGPATLANFTSGGSIQSQAALTLSGTTTLSGVLAVSAGTVTAGGAVNLTAGGGLDLQAGTFTANSAVSAGSGSSITIGAGTSLLTKASLILNGGTLTREAGGNFSPAAGSSLFVQNGGVATFEGGLDYTNNHAVTVSGGSSRLNVTSGGLSVDSGGSLNVLGGAATAVDGGLTVGGGTAGTVLVDGFGSRLTVAGTGAPGPSAIGGSAAGSLTVGNGATALVSHALQVGPASGGGSGELKVLSGGKFSLAGDGSALVLGSAAGGGAGTLEIGKDASFSASTGAGGGTVLNPTGTVLLNGGTADLGAVTLNGGKVDLNRGLLTFQGALTTGDQGILGLNPELSTGRSVSLSGATTVAGGESLTVNGGSLTTGSLSSSGTTVVSDGGSLTVKQGPLQVGDGGTASIRSGGVLALEGQDVLVEQGGTLAFDASSTSLGLSSVRVSAGGTAGYSGNAAISGGFLLGAGVHEVGSGGAAFSGTSLMPGASFQINGTASLTNFTGGGTISGNAPLVWNGGQLTSSGTLDVTASGSAVLSTFSSAGVIHVSAGGAVSGGPSSLYLSGGSRTTVDSGGSLGVGAGASIELNGGLLVNNGTQSGLMNINYGSLAKGSGTFGTVNVADGGTFSPGNSPGNAHFTGDFTAGAGGSLVFELNQANYVTGDGHADYLNIDGHLLAEAGTSSGDWFTIRIVSLDFSNNPSPLGDFDSTQSYSFTLASAGEGIDGFDPAEFRIDSSGFLNPLNGGTFAVTELGNQLLLTFTPVPEPGFSALAAGGAILLISRRRRMESTSA